MCTLLEFLQLAEIYRLGASEGDRKGVSKEGRRLTVLPTDTHFFDSFYSFMSFGTVVNGYCPVTRGRLERSSSHLKARERRVE